MNHPPFSVLSATNYVSKRCSSHDHVPREIMGGLKKGDGVSAGVQSAWFNLLLFEFSLDVACLASVHVSDHFPGVRVLIILRVALGLRRVAQRTLRRFV